MQFHVPSAVSSAVGMKVHMQLIMAVDWEWIIKRSEPN